jgi:hypothetical protein
MNKLKMLVLTALAAATVGTGALAAAPSASAARAVDCEALFNKFKVAHDLATIYGYYGDHVLYNYYTGLATAYADSYSQYC